ncbi:MAG: Mini-ribonuclease 3 [Anaerofustis sp.]|jgi:ribonuclease-3 family protein
MEKNLSVTQISMLNTGELAYLGDSVYDTAVRKGLLLRGVRKNSVLVRTAQHFVSASAQSGILEQIESLLTAEERSVVERGKNAKPKKIPKSATQKQYASATALEALFGYLSLKEDYERMNELIDTIFAKAGVLL